MSDPLFDEFKKMSELHYQRDLDPQAQAIANPDFMQTENRKLSAEITRLKSVIQLLVEAVTPFAEHAVVTERVDEWGDNDIAPMEIWNGINCLSTVSVGDLRRALSAKTKADEILKGEG